MPAPTFAPMQPMQAPPSYPAAEMPLPRNPPPRNSPPAVPASAPRAAAPKPRRPLVRAKAPDEPAAARPTLLVMPSPDKLGVAIRPTIESPNWAALHMRMKELGVVSFHMDTLADGRSRFICWLPQRQAGTTRRIETTAASEAEAVRVGLEKAAQLRTSP